MRKTKINTHNYDFPGNSFFFENKLVFYKRKEGHTWEEERRDEKGMGTAESVISEFEKYYRPNNLEVARDHPDEIIHGVRDRMMQGPLGATNILSGGSILERRVYESLQRTIGEAPRLYAQMINEEIRQGDRPIEVARNMFAYDINYGESYLDLLATLQADIMGLGFIGPPTFTDSRGERINLANPNQTNEFDVAVGAPGTSGNVKVVVQWHREDLTTIRNKLEQAGIWADFSRQDNAREFLHFKFRQTLIKRTLWKEKTKLSKDKFDSQRLKSWLEEDLHQRALNDETYQEWYNQWSADRATTRGITLDQFQNLSATDLTIAERNELTRNQREARERAYDNSLEAKLKKILTPGEIENVTKSLETRTMLAYLFYKLRDREDRENVEEMIDEMAGIDYDSNIETLRTVAEKISNFINEISPKIEARDEKATKSTDISNQTTELETEKKRLEDEITGFNALLEVARKHLYTPATYKYASTEINSLNKQIKTTEAKIKLIDKKIKELLKEKTKVDEELRTMDADLVKATREFGEFISNKTANRELWGNTNELVNTLNTRIADINNQTSTADKITDLKTFLTTPAEIKKAKDVLEATKTRTKHFERLKEKRPASEKMDSRGLLFKLVKRDIELKGATADPRIIEESLITTNLLIAQARNQEIYGNVNQSIARRIEQDTGINEDDYSTTSRFFFSPIMSGAEAIEHICDTDGDLNRLESLNINSTPADIIRIMQQNNMVSATKLRELQKKLSELIRGIDLNGKRRRIVDNDVPKVEKFINNLVLVEARLSAESRLQEISEGFYDTSKTREQQVLQMLQNQTDDSIDADNRIAEDLESHNADFKRFFLRRELSAEYNQAMDELEGLPKEDRQAELRRRGLTVRVQSRGVFSLRATRLLRKYGMKFLRYAGYGLYKSGSWFYNYAKSIIWTDDAKKRAGRIRAGYKGAIIEPVTTVTVGWPLAIGSYIISRPKTWLRKISDWGENKVNK